MIRGRIDLLIPTAGGVALVDYKTDNVAGAALEQRAEGYKQQMRLYAKAIRTVAKAQIVGDASRVSDARD